MTEIDFYINRFNEEQRDVFICKLINKAYHTGHYIFLLTQDVSESEKLNDLMWSFANERFLPHGIDADNDQPGAIKQQTAEAVLIHHESGKNQGICDILINYSSSVPDCFSQYNRTIEVINNAPDAIELSRENYKFYKQRGYIIRQHDLVDR